MFKVELITLEWILHEKLRVKNLWESDMQCWGLNTRCSSEGPMFSHLVPNWWNCLGWSEPLWSGTLLEEVGYWGKAMMFCLSAPLPVHSLPPNCNTINQLLAPATYVPPPPGAKCSLPWHILTLWMSKTLLTCASWIAFDRAFYYSDKTLKLRQDFRGKKSRGWYVSKEKNASYTNIALIRSREHRKYIYVLTNSRSSEI